MVKHRVSRAIDPLVIDGIKAGKVFFLVEDTGELFSADGDRYR